MNEKPLLTIPETAKILSIGKTKAYKLAKRGTIPTVRIDKSIRVPKEALYKWIKNNTKTEGIIGNNKENNTTIPNSVRECRESGK